MNDDNTNGSGSISVDFVWKTSLTNQQLARKNVPDTVQFTYPRKQKYFITIFSRNGGFLGLHYIDGISAVQFLPICSKASA